MLPRVVITGASGFLGRHLIEALRDDHRILAIDLRSRRRAEVEDHPNVVWRQADVGEAGQLRPIVAELAGGPVDTILHLAAYYDFSGHDHPEYTRTNIAGLKNVLDAAVELGVGRFVFASSLAACAFPRAGQALTEASAPDGDHVYARSKRAGEELVGTYQHAFPTTIVRLAALFSDWCEYAPLFVFLATWLSKQWNARVLGGRGLSAIPYLHVRDAAAFFRRVVERQRDLPSGEVLIASPDEAVSHRDLFATATLAYFGRRLDPVFMPAALCGPGLVARDLIGRAIGHRPFERPWMRHYIDLEMRVDATVTRQVLGWAPRPRLGILRRLPFLVENLKTDPLEWRRRNQAAMKVVWVSDYLKIAWLLQQHEGEILAAFTEGLRAGDGPSRFPHYANLSAAEERWNQRMLFQQLLNAVRTGEKGIFMAYCRDLARRRFTEGFEASELCGALDLLNLTCMRILRRHPESAGLRQQMLDYLTMTLRFGCDEAQDTFERLAARRSDARDVVAF